MKRILIIVATLCAALVWLSSCMSEEKFETAAGDRLRFSVDTLQMDTVLSGVGTPTKTFSIHNDNSDGVSITSVAFAGGVSNGFQVNVDGVYINNGFTTPIDCRSGDSLRVFVELKADTQNSDTPQFVSSRLVFTLANGVQQSVVLTAYSQDAILLRNLHVTSDTTLSARRPYLVRDSLTVEAGAILRLSPGVRLYFHSDAGLRVDGQLLAEGTMKNPVVMRGDRTDYMFPGQPYDRVAGQWQGVHFTEKSYGNRLEWCDIHSGSYGLLCDSSDVTREKVRIENTVIHNVTGDVLRVLNSKIFVGNSQLTNAGSNCLTIYGGDVDFVHCTIANFYPLGAYRGNALVYTNEYHNAAYPLVQARFRNCIITGYADDEIYGSKSTQFKTAAFNYGFFYCLLNTAKIEKDDNVLNNQWDLTENKVSHKGNFRKFNDGQLIYDFCLDSLSLAIGNADATLSGETYPLDRRGVVRLSDGKSDAGCYEYVGN